jgi:hypothetical protein
LVVVVVLLLLNVLDVIEVAELLLRIKGGSGRTSSADFSNLLSNSSTLESANSGTSAENNKEKRKSRYANHHETYGVNQGDQVIISSSSLVLNEQRQKKRFMTLSVINTKIAVVIYGRLCQLSGESLAVCRPDSDQFIIY